jgi:hypothetical protein
VRPGKNVTGTSVAFAGLSAYAQLLNEVLTDEGIQVPQLIIPGAMVEGDRSRGRTSWPGTCETCTPGETASAFRWTAATEPPHPALF